MRRYALFLALFTVGVGQPMLQLYGSNPAVFTSADIHGVMVALLALLLLVVPPAVLASLHLLVGFLPAPVRTVAQPTVLVIGALPVGMVLLRSVDLPWPVVMALAEIGRAHV